jgi:nitrogen regulatory protein P-II 1
MKKIEAIIRKTKFDEVKEALNEVGIDFFSYWDVRGIGQARQERVYRGVVYDTSSIERTKLSIIVRDKNVDKTVKAILDTARTGEIGDGKIFVVDIQQSYRIRTGESGDEALFIKGLEE